MQLTNLFALASLATGALSLGINCRGNSNCGGTLCKLTDILSQVRNLPQGNLYNPGDHIACCGDKAVASGLCAFVQGNFNGQMSASRAGDLLQQLVNHGCGKCGSVPVNFPGSNDPGNGILTVNWVSQR
ncbi:hypothetical protein PG987_009484 [Apiospora arundinis]